SRRFPDFFARLLVECNYERRGCILLVGLHDDKIVEEDWRRRRPHAESADVSELRFPHQLAFEVVRIETFCAEERVDHLAVGGRCRCSIGTLAVTIVEGRAFPCGLLPNELA